MVLDYCWDRGSIFDEAYFRVIRTTKVVRIAMSDKHVDRSVWVLFMVDSVGVVVAKMLVVMVDEVTAAVM